MRFSFWFMYGEVVSYILGCIFFISVIVCSVFFVAEKRCEQKATKQELEYDWGILQGCMVRGIETNNKWVDYDRLRIFDAKE